MVAAISSDGSIVLRRARPELSDYGLALTVPITDTKGAVPAAGEEQHALNL